MQLLFELILLFAAEGANLAQEVRDLLFGLGLHCGLNLQEKGFVVKNRLPLTDWAFF